MKPVMRKLSPDTKAALQAQFDAAGRRAYARGDGAGWRRGFRVGLACGVAGASLLALCVVGAAWVLA